jgi:hypothetical protein
MASLPQTFTDGDLIRAIRGQQDRVRQTHRDYRLACEDLRTLCDLATRLASDSAVGSGPHELQGQR